MSISIYKRFFCLLVAFVICFGCLARPITANATGVIETAGLVGISPQVAIPAILLLLGFTFVQSSAFDAVCRYVEQQLTELLIAIEGISYVPGYRYDDQIYVEEDVVAEIEQIVYERYVDNKVPTEQELNEMFLYQSAFQLYDSYSTRYVIWANYLPVVETYDTYTQLTLRYPCVVWEYFSNGVINKHDHSDDTSTGIYPLAWSNTVPYTEVLSRSTTDTDEILDTLSRTGIWIVDTTDDTGGGDPEEEKKRVFPITDTLDKTEIEDTDIVETDTEVEVDITGQSTDLTGIYGWLSRLWYAITGLPTRIANAFASSFTSVTGWLSKVQNTMNNIGNLLSQRFFVTLNNILAKINTWYTDLQTWLDELGTNITEPITDFADMVYNAIATHVAEMANDVGALRSNLRTWLDSLADKLLGGVQGVFVPTTDYLTMKVEALRAKFDWIGPVIDFGKSIQGELASSTPPVIYVYLDDAESSYDYGGTVKFLDMSWYAKYKAQGDAILSGFLWALFAWRMYQKLPSIINGVAGDVGHISNVAVRRFKE